MEIYKCPICKYARSTPGECPACFDETGRLIMLEKKAIEPTPVRMHIVDGQFFTCDGC